MDIAVIGSNNVDLISYIDRMPTGTVDDMSAAASTLLRRGCRNDIVAPGERSALWLNAESQRITGGTPIPEALRFACADAAGSVRLRGTRTSLATTEEFSRWRRPAGADDAAPVIRAAATAEEER